MIRIALAGQPNCGKTTLFNRLTGQSLPTGNFPGVTVAAASAPLPLRQNWYLTDLPGLYSLHTLSPEEAVARTALLRETECIIDLITPQDLPRGLYLTMQLLGSGVPMVVALHRMEGRSHRDGYVDVPALSRALGVPVVSVNAATGQGLETLLDTVAQTLRQGLRPAPVALEGPAGAYLSQLTALLSPSARRAAIPPAFAAECWAWDSHVPAVDGPTRQKALSLESALKAATGQSVPTALAAARWRQIDVICQRCHRPPAPPGTPVCALMDGLTLTSPLSLPVFFGVVLGLFVLTFHVVGPALCRPLGEMTALGAAGAQRLLYALGAAPWLIQLITQGLFAGVGRVVEFLPMMWVLFFLLSLLEQSGYLARGAMVLDGPLGALGVSGRSAVPLLMGFGCTVPAALAARTLPTRRERRLTIFLLPFMPCSAKIPIATVLCAAVAPGHGGMALLGLYLLTAALGLVLLCLAGRLAPGEHGPFVLELPPWRRPSIWKALETALDRGGDFLRRAFGPIFLTALGVWLLSHMGIGLRPAPPEESLLAALGEALVPLLRPIGLGQWRIAAALVAGLAAKENILATLAVLTAGSAIPSLFSPASAWSFLVFVLLYSPCAAALCAMGREGESRLLSWLSGAMQTLLAYGCACALYRLASWIAEGHLCINSWFFP